MSGRTATSFLQPREGLILERHFDHVESEETNTQLSVALKSDEIVTTQKKNIVKSEFTDLRYESETNFIVKSIIQNMHLVKPIV